MLMYQPEGISAGETKSWVVLIAGGEEKVRESYFWLGTRFGKGFPC